VKDAYDRLVSRHAVLRTSFVYDLYDEPLQLVRKQVPSNFWSKEAGEYCDIDVYIKEEKQRDRERGFDLGAPFQMRLDVLDMGGYRYEFSCSHHHILGDGWCMGILIRDFYEILNALHQGGTPDLPKVVPYSNYIEWLHKVNTSASLEYW